MEKCNRFCKAHVLSPLPEVEVHDTSTVGDGALEEILLYNSFPSAVLTYSHNSSV